MENDDWNDYQYEQLTIFDGSEFRLVMEGLWASIKLNKLKPDRGMTKEEAEERLRQWFPEAEIKIDGRDVV